jgi:hypothetical protein
MSNPLIPEHVEPQEPWPRPERKVEYIDVGKMSSHEVQKILDKMNEEYGFYRVVPMNRSFYIVARVAFIFSLLTGIGLAIMYVMH